MPITEPFNYESQLTAYLNGLTRDRVRPFFRLHPNHPLVKAIMMRNEFYSKILVCSILGQEPTLRSFYLFPDDAEELYQNGLYLYNKWKAMGVDKAVFNYCQLMNRLFARIPMSKAEAAGESFPDLCNFEYQIREFVRGLFHKNADHKPVKSNRNKKNEFLALNA